MSQEDLVAQTDAVLKLNTNGGPSSGDPVVLPNHYARWKIEPVFFIMENNLPFWMGNVIKYIMRHEFKNGLEDLKKARRYLDMEIAKMEGKENWSR